VLFDEKGDELDGLIEKAKSIIAERAEILALVEKSKSQLSESEQLLGSARRRVSEEEFESAQAPGGLAVASKSALGAVAGAELNIKSIKLRLVRLHSKLAETEQRLPTAQADLARYRRDFADAAVEALGEEWDDAIGAIIRLLSMTWVIQLTCSSIYKEHSRAQPVNMISDANLGNPVKGHRGAAITGLLFRRAGGLNRSINKLYLEDPDASRLQGDLQRIKDRIAEVSADMSTDEGHEG